ncbi:MAG: DUF1761 domain-containing protein [Bacteroidota bacterium]
MDLSGINLGEIIVAALSTFIIGFLWYGDFLFGKRWRGLSGISEEKAQSGHMLLIFGGSFVLNLIIAAALSIFTEVAMMLGTSALYAGIMAFLLCFVFVATSFGVNYLFAQKPLKLYLIDVGYMLVSFFIMGLIVGAWY